MEQTDTATTTTTPLTFNELPYYLTVWKNVDKETDTVTVHVESRIHVNRIVKCPKSWSTDFVRNKPKMFEDAVFGWIVKKYGLEPMPMKYW